MKPYYDEGGITIYHGDCRELLPVCGRPYVVVTDPPYGTGGWRRGKAGAGADPTAGFVREEWDDGATDWLRLVPNAWVLTFWPAGRALQLLTEAEGCGFSHHRCVYMRKRDPKPGPANRPIWSVEPIWVLGASNLWRGDDMLEVSTPRLGRDSDATGHPYQKPLGVMQWLLAQVAEGATVVDPFMGSGTTLLAAKNLGLRAIGIEQDKRWCEVAIDRLGQGILGEAA